MTLETNRASALALVAFLALAPMLALGEEKPVGPALPDDPDQAWAKVQELTGANNATEALKDAVPLADHAAAFISKFPKDERVKKARRFALQGYGMATAYTDDKDAAKKFEEFSKACLADKSIPEDERLDIYIAQAQVRAMRAIGGGPENVAANQDRLLKAMVETALGARAQFPGNKKLYGTLLTIAQQTQDAKIAAAIVESEDAPAAIKQQAKALAEGKKAFEVGKPLDIKFTAVDGREVDLSKMKGKVVLIDFWATWCGPCVAELPTLKKAYDKHHGNGFEIVGISFDQDKDALAQFVKEKQMPWPQYFDGEGWGNQFGVRYGIKGIPTMWLIDKDGNLADLNARGNLEQKVEKLLSAKTVQ